VIFRSIVGKLWITIIILVSVIMLFLSIFLIESVDRYYYEKQSNDLIKLADNINGVLEKYDDKNEALIIAKEIVEAYQTNMVILDQTNKINNSRISDMFTEKELEELFSGERKVARLTNELQPTDPNYSGINDLLTVAIPIDTVLSEKHQSKGALVLYQSLYHLYDTTKNLKKIIFLFAGIGIVMTTIFAFFLSTRINSPIRQIQKAANRVAQGDFHTKVDIKTNDEIGDLAKSFNRMAYQLKETIHALSTEKEKLSNILKSMGDGVITLNKKGEIIVTNPPARRLLNTWEEATTNELPVSLKEMLDDVIRKARISVKDILINGRSYSVVMTPLYSEDAIKGTVTLLRDVTYERKLDKLRKDFLANVSHELRTPLSMLQGYSEAILDDIAQTDAEKKELAQIIYDESLRMGRLVNELLDLARMESGKIQLQFCRVNIESMLKKIVNKFSTLAQESDIDLDYFVEPNLSIVFLDADRMEQVLTNLTDNALRHTPKQGSIQIRARSYSVSELLIEVKDTGVGIPEDDLPFVFERFYKADKARTRGHAGTGLGLSIVKNVVEAHGGKITVTSKLEHGTTFSIIIPTHNLPNT